MRIILTALLFVATSANGLAWTLPGTGVTKCYNNASEIACPAPGEPFYGQDGNFNNTQYFLKNGTETVTDPTTGLTWQQMNPAHLDSCGNVESYCSNLEIGGKTDWRVPTTRELRTLLDFGVVSAPTINGDFDAPIETLNFPFWSSNVGTLVGSRWDVSFENGETHARLCNETGIQGNVICLRGQQLEPANFIDNGDGTISDTSTNLIWEKYPSDYEMNWQEALAYCESRVTASHNDWRLPNIQELHSIYDPSVTSSLFFEYPNSWYWSASNYGLNLSRALASYRDGASSSNPKEYNFRVRCIIRYNTGECPDSDNDGVPNSKDQCLNTPSGSLVNNVGCPDVIPDADADGVPDAWDQCADTPVNTPVNRHGCPDRRGGAVIPLMSN